MEIAVKEFPKLSSRAIAELCGVHHTFVENQRPEQVATVATSRTGADGKQYPATRKPSKTATPEREEAEIITRGSADAATGDVGPQMNNPAALPRENGVI